MPAANKKSVLAAYFPLVLSFRIAIFYLAILFNSNHP